VADEYLVRWLDDLSVAQDLGITQGPDGDYRLAIENKTSITTIAGAASAVTVGATANMVNLIAPADYYLRGFNLTGDTDALFTLSIAGSTVAIEKLTPIKRVANFTFPGYLFVASGQAILLTVKNTGVITSDYQGSLYRGL
jgi:hypothetical protein